MTRGSLTIAVDLPAVEEAERLLRACLLPLRPLGIAVTGSDALLRRLAVTVRQEPKTYLGLVECLSRLDEWSLRKWSFPPLYQSGIVYEAETDGAEVWQTTPALYLRGRGDCEDLAAHRVAEHRVGGERARVNMVLSGRTSFGGRLFHFNVLLPSGRIEDPSRVLGME